MSGFDQILNNWSKIYPIITTILFSVTKSNPIETK